MEIRWEGRDELVAAMLARADAAPEAAKDVSHALALAFVAAAKKNATGPARVQGTERRTRGRKGSPAKTLAWGAGGPGVVTGFLRNSIQVRTDATYGAGGWSTTVHPSGPYYRRLELGFTGTDSIGRRYNQPPYPFMRPALDTVRGKANGIAKRGFGKALKAA